jgi:hypothetical protein
MEAKAAEIPGQLTLCDRAPEAAPRPSRTWSGRPWIWQPQEITITCIGVCDFLATSIPVDAPVHRRMWGGKAANRSAPGSFTETAIRSITVARARGT